MNQTILVFDARCLFLLLALSILAAASDGMAASDTPEILSWKPKTLTVPVYRAFEATFSLPRVYENPFDPDQIDVRAVFTSPAGAAHRVNGFWSQPFTRSLVDGEERLEPAGEPAWTVRFAPAVPGKWTYRIVARDAAGSGPAKTGAFTAASAKPKGFIRRSSQSKHYLRYDDGSPYFAIGENAGWAGKRGTYDYDDWYAALGKAGGNWARVWLVHWNMGLEWSGKLKKNDFTGYQGAGRYALENAWRIDRMLEAAAQNGIGVMLTFGTYGDLKADAGYFGEQSWSANPYNTANGGPCATPADFFTHPSAKALYKRKMRYLVARCGHSTAVQSWEFFNEMPAPAAWVEEMSRTLRDIDPYDHLISHTYGDDAIWKLPSIDFTQNHHYGDGSLDDSAPVIAATNRDFTSRYPKPHLMAEFGIDWKKSDRDYDPNGAAVNLHNGLWASTVSRGMGTAMLWYWDNYVHPLNVYHEFTSLARFAARVPWADREWTLLSGKAIDNSSEERFSDLTVPAAFGWGKAPGDAVYRIGSDGAIEGGAVPQFLFSEAKSDLRTTPAFVVEYRRPGRFLLRVADVTGENRLVVRLDGRTVLDEPFPSGSGTGPWKSTELAEWGGYRSTYDREVGFDVPEGRHEIVVENAAGDWIHVAGLRLTNYRSSRHPAVRVLGQASGRRAIVWIQDEKSTWMSVRDRIEPATWDGLDIELAGLPAGRYRVTWWDTRAGKPIRTSAASSTGGMLLLKPPSFRRDIAADIEPEKADPSRAGKARASNRRVENDPAAR